MSKPAAEPPLNREYALELKDGVVNVPPAVSATATRSPKSELIEQCHKRWKKPPKITTRQYYETMIELPDGRTVITTAEVHSDSQRKACKAALTVLNKE